MKNEGQIRHQLQQTLYRHTKRTLETRLKCVPENCRWNKELTGSTQNLRVCTHVNHPAQVCDVNHGGIVKAKDCFDFEPQTPKEEVKAEIKALVQGDRGALARQMPDVVALLWVLDSTDEPIPDVPDELLEIEEDYDVEDTLTLLERLRVRFGVWSWGVGSFFP